MTEYETKVVDALQRVVNFLDNISSDVESFFTWFQDEFSVIFFPLLMIIIGLLVLKWIVRW